MPLKLQSSPSFKNIFDDLNFGRQRIQDLVKGAPTLVSEICQCTGAESCELSELMQAWFLGPP